MRVFVEDRRYPDRVTHATGYAEVQRQIILGLSQLGVPVGFPACAAALAATRLIPESQRDQLLALCEQSWPDDPDVVHLQVASPEGFEQRPGRLTVGLTMTERESLAGYTFDWVGRCNRLDAILTPSHWNRQVFERHGIHNLHVVPLGADTESFVPEPLRFLSIFAGFGWPGSRTNWEDLRTAFRAEFEGSQDVEWTILSLESRKLFEFAGLRHTARQLPQDLAQWFAERWAPPVPRIEVVDGNALDAQTLRALYRRHDCFLAYSREGWGLPALEALASGLEVISSDFGVQGELLKGSPVQLFAAGQISDDNLSLVGGDLAKLRRHLREFYDRRRAGRRWVEGLAWQRTLPHLRDVLESLQAAWRSGVA